MLAAVRDALVVTLVMAVVACIFNAVRKGGIPFIQETEYQILVPCPEPIGEVERLDPADSRLNDDKYLFVDARSESEFKQWHLDNARNVVFDFLEETPSETINDLAKQRARGLIVYGDGQDPDSGRELAREIAGRGIKNVFYIEGGAPALWQVRGGSPGQAPGGRTAE